MRLDLGAVSLAPGEEDGARLTAASARLERGDEGWRLVSGEAEGVRVRYVERVATERSPIWARLRRHGRRGAALLEGEERPTPGDPARRDEAPESEEAALADAVGSALAGIGPRLADGARLRLEGLAVTVVRDGDERPVLRELEAELVALGEGRYRFEGSGRPGRGGRLGWSLSLEPRELRAEGNVDFQRVPFALLLPVVPSLPW